ncbi:unnamed protein product [Cyprideis torosa]|uniref:Uncharacterized protein n=1 Tax=Cyprideis torosa TaxID=163714 RepID=A0A7R8WT63_9CRUS|nr:unnamed protein product [Cyprideis torosa]CAG0904504.1 unnamed protein product [Cyprideis torosa]
MQVLLFSLFLTCICKQEPDDEDDSDQDEREPHLQYNETWLENDTTESREPKVYRPMTREGLYDLREKRKNEIQMWTIIKEIIIYTIYLIILIIIARGLRDPSAYYMRESMQESFIGAEDPVYSYPHVLEANKYWEWMHNVVFYELVVQNWYNGQPPFLLRGYLEDRVNRLMGYGILRQIRSKPNTCRVADVFTTGKENFTCTGLATFIYEDDKDYCEYWKDPDTVMDYLKECQNEAFRYRTADELDALPTLSKPLDEYSGGGYVMEFRGRTVQLQEKLKELQRKHWIDQYTRGVFLEFYTYNVNVNLFGIAQISAEFVPGGGIHPSWRFDVIRLIDDRVLTRVCEILFACFTFYYTIRILRLLWKYQRKFFHEYWNWVELVLVCMSYAAIGVYVLRMLIINEVLERFAYTRGNGYMRLQKIAIVDDVYTSLIALLVFTATIFYLKLLRFNKRIGLLSATMRQCWNDLSGFGVVFLFFFAAFCFMFYMFLHVNMFEWRNLLTAMESTFGMVLGKVKFDRMKEVNLLASLIYFAFTVIVGMILINIFLSIIIKAFIQARLLVKSDVLKQTSDHEIIPFFRERIRIYAGMSSRPGMKVAPMLNKERHGDKHFHKTDDSDVAQMPEKWDRFMELINAYYFNGELDVSDTASMKEKNKFKHWSYS